MSAKVSRNNPKGIRILERTHSPDSKADLKLRHADIMSSPLSDYESFSRGDSSHSDDEYSSRSRSPRPRRRKPKSSRPDISTTADNRPEQSQLSPNSRAWYEFDLAVVVALVSPLGNWLTGTDHVKNIVLIVLLVYYLHQIIEVPWNLYKNARPRTSHKNVKNEDTHAAALAATELRRLELLFLGLALASPLIGAALLRYATEALLGAQAVSWFSTSLFVLATGLRPCTHLAERLAQRTTTLHNVVHAPPPTTEAIRMLEARVATLEEALARVTAASKAASDEVQEYVDSAIDAVEHALHKHERRWGNCVDRVSAAESDIQLLSAQTSRMGTPVLQHGRHTGGILFAIRRALAADLVALKAAMMHALPTWISTPVRAATSPNLLLHERTKIGSGRGPTAGSPTVSPLSTIHEEEIVPHYTPSPSKSMLGRIIAWLYSLLAALAVHLAFFATLPVRAVGRLASSRDY